LTARAGAICAPGTGGSGGNSGHARPWKIMPLGDSITATTCVPQLLAKKLNDNNHGPFTFVGTALNEQECGGAAFVRSEGHGGYLVTELMGSRAGELTGWCARNEADVVLMHFGTNDVWSRKSTQSILDAYSAVLSALRAVNHKVIVFVAQIIPLNPENCPACGSRVVDLNSKIPAWAASKSTAESPVYVVDVHSAFAASSYVANSPYTQDGCHPNLAGSQLIADKWYAALLAKGLP
jgi:lysophospholipase L1-like esterase